MITLDDVKKNRAERRAREAQRKEEKEKKRKEAYQTYAQWAAALCEALSRLTWAAGQGLPEKKMIFKEGNLFWSYSGMAACHDNIIVTLHESAANTGEIVLVPDTHCWPMNECNQYTMETFEEEILDNDPWFTIDD